MMKKNYAMLAAMLMCLNSVAVSAPVNKVMAVSDNLAEKISEEKTVWGRHTLVSSVFEEVADPAFLPESKRESVDAVKTNDRMYGLAFRIEGEIPETIGDYTVHYFQEYCTEKNAQYDAFKADKNGCFVGSYAYYEEFLKNYAWTSAHWDGVHYAEDYWEYEDLNFDNPEGDTRLNQFTDGRPLELSDTDSLVFLMVRFPEEIQVDEASEEAYFTDVEKAFLSCDQLSFVGEIRRIEQVYYYNLDGLNIICADGSVESVFNSEALADYSPKSFHDSVIHLSVMKTEEARKIRAVIRQNPDVVEAQIDYSYVCTGSDAFVNGIYAADSVNYVPGDVSMDGEVNVDDAQLVLKAYAETLAGNPIVLSPEQVKLSHVYGAEEENHICMEDSQAIFICAVDRLAGLVTDVSAFFEDYTANNTIPWGKECIYKN